MNPFAAFVPLLGFEAEGGDRPCVKTRKPDRFTGFLAIAVGPILDTTKGFVDLGNEFPLAIRFPR